MWSQTICKTESGYYPPCAFFINPSLCSDASAGDWAGKWLIHDNYPRKKCNHGRTARPITKVGSFSSPLSLIILIVCIFWAIEPEMCDVECYHLSSSEHILLFQMSPRKWKLTLIETRNLMSANPHGTVYQYHNAGDSIWQSSSLVHVSICGHTSLRPLNERAFRIKRDTIANGHNTMMKIGFLG